MYELIFLFSCCWNVLPSDSFLGTRIVEVMLTEMVWLSEKYLNVSIPPMQLPPYTHAWSSKVIASAHGDNLDLTYGDPADCLEGDF